MPIKVAMVHGVTRCVVIRWCAAHGGELDRGVPLCAGDQIAVARVRWGQHVRLSQREGELQLTTPRIQLHSDDALRKLARRTGVAEHRNTRRPCRCRQTRPSPSDPCGGLRPRGRDLLLSDQGTAARSPRLSRPPRTLVVARTPSFPRWLSNGRRSTWSLVSPGRPEGRSSANVRSGCAVFTATSRCSRPANTRDRNLVC